MQRLPRTKQIPGHCCCVRGPYRSHRCLWPPTQNKYWSDRTVPSWSAQRPVWPSWLFYELPQTLSGRNEITLWMQHVKLHFPPVSPNLTSISPSLVSWNLSRTLSSFSMAFILGALILWRMLCCSFRRCCSVFVSALISSSDNVSCVNFGWAKLRVCAGKRSPSCLYCHLRKTTVKPYKMLLWWHRYL